MRRGAFGTAFIQIADMAHLGKLSPGMFRNKKESEKINK
jgi:hypothetical protein